jgi:hypothetical protein
MKIAPLLTILGLIVFNVTPMIVKAQSPLPSPTAKDIPQTLRVGIAGEPPGVIIPEDDLDSDMAVTGVAVETWETLANALELEYELVYEHSVVNVLEKLAKGEIDVAVGGITTTDTNIHRFDLTQPLYQDNLSILVPIQSRTLWTVIRPFLRWAFLSSVIVIFLCLFTVGNLLWLAEHNRNSEQFPKAYIKGVREGMWCALTTFHHRRLWRSLSHYPFRTIYRRIMDDHFRGGDYFLNSRGCHHFSDRFFCSTLPKISKT